VRVAERAPEAAGVNVMLTEHDPPAGMTGPVPSLWQVKVENTSAKSPGFGPPAVGGPVRWAGSLPEFEKVNVLVADWPGSTFPKFIGLGDSERRAFRPVPDRLT
jgi:hypothetical protein